jgi:hypothetical protein
VNKPTIFISYSRKDDEWKERLASHLGVAEKLGQLWGWRSRWTVTHRMRPRCIWPKPRTPCTARWTGCGGQGCLMNYPVDCWRARRSIG